MKKITIVFLVFLCSASVVYAGTTGKITGTVKDAAGQTLPGANVVVQVEGILVGAATDANGQFFILAVPPGLHTVKASMVGYQDVTQTEVRVKIDQTSTLNFSLREEVLAAEELVVVAERPPVEVDLTGSKAVMSSVELDRSFVANIKQAVDTQQGVNYNGGIRGGFGLDVSYYVDGMELRDGASNSNWTGINTSTVQELEVLSGGYNAEYGRANGAVINMVTKSSRTRVHSTLDYKMRPAGIYHWGGHIYGPERYENRVMSNPDWWNNHPPPGWFGTGHVTAADEYKKGLRDNRDGVNTTLAQHWIMNYLTLPWIQDLKEYDTRTQHGYEGTLYGPLTKRASFMASGRYHKGVPKYPSALNYNPEWNLQGALTFDVTQNSRVKLQGMHGGFNNTDQFRTLYGSSEDNGLWQNRSGAHIAYPSNSWKFFPFVAQGTPSPTPRSPEYVRMWSGQSKLTHIFDPRTFLDVNLSYFWYFREANYRRDNLWKTSHAAYSKGFDWNEVLVEEENKRLTRGTPFRGVGRISGVPGWGLNYPGDHAQDYAKAYNYTIKADFTKQVDEVHQLKAGLYGSYQFFDRYFHFGYISTAWVTDPIARDTNPYEGAIYIQDKIETRGMIVNAGLRVDMYNVNAYVSDDVFDPLRIDEDTPGNVKQSEISIGDPYGYKNISSTDEFAVHTPTQWAISPRIGISHPITDKTVLHFMYGHFNQRPSWQKMTNTPFMQLRPYPETDPILTPLPADYGQKYGYSYTHWAGAGNPGLEFEKMIQYEVGFDQNIADLLNLDVTLYYKDGKNLTAAGFRNDESFLAYYGTYTGTGHRLFPDFNGLGSRGPGKSGSLVVNGNMFFQDVRGLEITMDSRFQQYAHLKFHYNLSYSNTGIYGLRNVYRVQPDGQKARPDSRHGANNRDKGVSGRDNAYWNPRNSAKLTATVFTPANFGPVVVGGWRPLGDWNVNLHSTWNQGFKYTYHSPGDPSTEPLNMRWKPMWNTNMMVSKGFDNIIPGTRTEINVTVINLFNQKQLRLPSGNNLQQYHEQGRLPFVVYGTGEFREEEDDVWRWYNQRQMPREVIFGVQVRW